MSLPSYTRNDLASDLAARLNCDTKTAKQVVEHFLFSMQNALASGKKLEFRGFCVIEPVLRKERTGRNPRDPSSGVYVIPTRTVIRFKVGKELDRVLNIKT